MVRTSDGLIYRDLFSSLTGWTSSGASADAIPGAVVFARSPIITLDPLGSGGADHGGVREGQILVDDDGTWWLLYGAGDGTNPWRVQVASSVDRGLNWTRHGETGFGLQKTDNPTDGYWSARDHLYTEKRGSTYYLHAMSAGSLGGGTIPGPSFESDLFTAASMLGPWTFVRRICVVNPSSGYDHGSAYAACVVKVGGTYYLYYSASNDDFSELQTALSSSSSPAGPFTRIGELLAPGQKGQVENAKLAYSTALGLWVMIDNQTSFALLRGVSNRARFSSDLLDWHVGHLDVMREEPSHTPSGLPSCGLASFMYGPEAAVIEDANVGIPMTFDAGGSSGTAGYHEDRSIYYAVMETAPNVLRLTSAAAFRDDFDRADGDLDGDNGWTTVDGSVALLSRQADTGRGSAATRNYAIQNGITTITNPTVRAALVVGEGCGVGLAYRYVDLTHHYSMWFRILSGVSTITLVYENGGGGEVASGSSVTTAAYIADTPFSAEVRVNGTSHAVYIDGVLVHTFTDATHSAAGYCGVRNTDSGTGNRVAGTFEVINGSPSSASVSRSLTLGNFIAEFGLELDGGFLQFDYRIDGSNNGYRAIVTPSGWSLYKVTTGTPSLLTAGTATVFLLSGHAVDCKIVVSGSSHKLYLGGELQVDATDATFSSGTVLRLIGDTAKVRLLSIYAGDDVIVTGLTNGDVVTLRGPGGIPIATGTASGSSLTFSDLPHYPVTIVDIDGEDCTTVDGLIWGGDTLDLEFVSSSPSSSPSASLSHTPSTSVSASPSPSPSASPSPTPSSSLSHSPSPTPSSSLSASPSGSNSPSRSPSPTPSSSISRSKSSSPSKSPSKSRSSSPSRSKSHTPSASLSHSRSASPSHSPSPSLPVDAEGDLKAVLFSRPLENLVRVASSISVTTGSVVSGYGTDRLANGTPAYPFKITGTSLDIVFDFGAAVLVELPAILHSNLTVAARIQGHTSNSWGAPDIDVAFGVPTIDARGMFSAPWLDLSERTAKRYWRLHVSGNAHDVIIGELWLGKLARSLPRSYLLEGLTLGAEGQTVVHETNARVELAYEQATVRERIDGSFIVDADDLAELDGLVRAARFQARPFLFIPRSDVDDAWLVKYASDAFTRAPLVVDEVTRIPFPVRQVGRDLPWIDPDA